MSKILLNYLPPSDVYTPSAALSILKSFMQNEGFDTEIKYWNLLFKNVLPLVESDETEEVILPFLSIINDKNNNSLGNNRAAELLQKLLPQHKDEEIDIFTDILKESKTEIYRIIHKELQNINFEEISLFGISSKFHQWIPGMILSEEIKKISPNTKIIVGGFGSKEAALEAMKINKHFDFANWGEGEYPLLELSKQLQNESHEFDLVPRLVYRKDKKLAISTTNRSDYLDMENYLIPDFDDYFDSYSEPNEKYKIIIPINSSRACSWNKCKFCDYNRGYKYRARSPESIVSEIEYIAKKYKSACFSFVDNDIFVSPEHFEKMLDLMIQSMHQYDFDYEFWAEMIPNKKLNAKLLKKMQTAGFTQIFIGYDGISDSLLSKMHKSNNFSNNLFFVKYSLKYNIDPLVNIIKGIINETEEDVIESMNNLHFLRFFFHGEESSLFHEYVTLVISRMAKYYSMISEEEKAEYNTNSLADLMPDYFSNHNDRFNLFSWKKSIINNSANWEELAKKENFYLENRFTYKISQHNGIYSYRECINNKEIVNIDFDKPDCWDVLKIANERVYTFNQLQDAMTKLHPEISIERLKEILIYLKRLHLIYCNAEFSEIITVIDTTQEIEVGKFGSLDFTHL